MTPETEKRYQQLANHFYTTKLLEKPLSTSAILKALAESAQDYRPNTFRKLKNAISFDVRARGYAGAAEKILRFVNPVTAPQSTMKPKAKLKLVKSVSEDEFEKLLEHFQKAECYDEFCALVIVWYLGVRPCEMRAIHIIEGRFHIRGAKQSHEGTRGADRVLEIDDEHIRDVVEEAITLLKNSARSIGAIRDCFRKQCRSLWPRRKRHPTMKSFRHQFGSNLKISGRAPDVIAYMMGHQSTRSIEKYGDARKGFSGKLGLKAAPYHQELSSVRTPARCKTPMLHRLSGIQHVPAAHEKAPQKLS
tara:strand:+ start:4405 stop:5319 length:915 start_codon:yes stop_codon:yes gene_type:complete